MLSPATSSLSGLRLASASLNSSSRKFLKRKPCPALRCGVNRNRPVLRSGTPGAFSADPPRVHGYCRDIPPHDQAGSSPLRGTLIPRVRANCGPRTSFDAWRPGLASNLALAATCACPPTLSRVPLTALASKLGRVPRLRVGLQLVRVPRLTYCAWGLQLVRVRDFARGPANMRLRLRRWP